MIALQGPQVIAKLEKAAGEPLSQLKRYHCRQLRYLFFNFTVFRSGYTGEDGVEIICGNKLAQMAMGFLAKSGKDSKEQTLQPAGLGARDTLRIEAGMPLYGHELSEGINPVAAGLGWAVADDKDFIGAAAAGRGSPQRPGRKARWPAYRWPAHPASRRGRIGRRPAGGANYQQLPQPYAQSNHCHGVCASGPRGGGHGPGGRLARCVGGGNGNTAALLQTPGIGYILQLATGHVPVCGRGTRQSGCSSAAT